MDKIYKNIKSEWDFYQIPFSICDGQTGFGNEDWKCFINDKFYYSDITDEIIESSLNEDLSSVNIEKDWTNYTKYGQASSVFHAKRIAKLIKLIESGGSIEPISFYFDANSYSYDCFNHVEDGNHRIRALQYLKHTHFPAYLHGSHSKFLIKWLT